jgi:hypothetical protein
MALAGSYVDLNESNVYFAGRVGKGDWATWDDLTKEAALVQASRAVARLLPDGLPATDESWTDIPLGSSMLETVRDIVCEEAYETMRLENSASSKKRKHLRADGVASFSYGNASETFVKASTKLGGLASAEARYLLAHFTTSIRMS